MTQTQQTALYSYKAFVSYSHSADNRLAPVLRHALHDFAKTWYQLRAMRVFQDETGLSVTAALWPSIEAALSKSEYFILLAAPDAAASPWVQREVDWWLDHRPADHLLIVLTGGDIGWDDVAQDFDWNRTTALPLRLAKAFQQVPKYIDLRWAKRATDLSLRNPEFLTAVASISSTLQSRPLDELIGEDVLQHRRVRRHVAAGFAVLALTTVAAIGFGLLASQQRDEARRRLVQLNSANGSRAADGNDVSGALLWFSEAAKLEAPETKEQSFVRTRLTSLAGRHPYLKQVWAATGGVGGVEFSRDGRWVVLYQRQGNGVQVWDVEGKPASFKPLGQPVVDVASTPQAPRLLTIDRDGAFLWNARTGERLRSFAHEAPVEWAGFAGTNAAHVVTLARDYTARVWDAETGREVAGLKQVSDIYDATFDGDAATLLLRSAANELLLWDSRTNRRTVFDSRNPASANLSHDRRYVLAFGGDASAAVWNSETGRQVTSLGSWEWVDYACFSPDSRRVAMVSRNGWVIVWDISNDQEVRTMWHEAQVLRAAFSPDGKTLATVGADRRTRIWDSESGKEAAPPLWHEDTVNGVAFSPDGKRLVTTTANKLVRLWEFASPPSVTLPHRESVRSAAFNPDATRILTVTDRAAQLWETTGSTGKPQFVWSPGAQIYHAIFSSDGAYALTASEDRLARLWSVKTGKEIAALPHPARVRRAAFTGDRKMLLTASGPRLFIWDIADLPQAPSAPKLSLALENTVLYTEFSRDGGDLLTVEFGGTARVWNVTKGEERAELRRLDVRLARLSPDGKHLATAARNGALQIWKTVTGESLGKPVQSEYETTALAFSPNGQRVAVANEGSVRIRESQSGSAVTPRMQHKSRVLHVVFAPDGTRLLTASADGSARVWDASSGQPITEALEHREAVLYADFSPDGQQVVTASADNTARLWNVSPSRLDLREWTRRAQLLAARRIDETGAVVSIDTSKFLDLWKEENSRPK